MAANWLDELLATATNTALKIYNAAGTLFQRPAVQFLGAGQSVTDNPSTGRIEVTIPGHDALSATAPIVRTGTVFSITPASGSGAGSESAAHYTKVEGIGAGANVAAVAQGTGILVAGSAGVGTAPTRTVALDLTYTAVGGESGAHAGLMSVAHVDALDACTDALVFAAYTGFPTLPLIVDENMVITLPVSSGDVLIPIATSGHLDGAVAIVRILAGRADSLDVAADLHVEGDVFDPDEDYELRIQRVGDQWIARAVSLPALEADAPTIISATVYEADPDKLVVLCDRDMYASALTGLSLDFDVGTARTITGLDSGNGTSTLTYDLSGDIDGSDEFDLVVVSPNGLRSMNGTALGAVTIAVDNEVTPALTNVLIDLDVSVPGSVTTSSGAVTNVADQSGHANHVAQATSGKRPTYNASDATFNNHPTISHDHTVGHSLICNALQESGGAMSDKASYSLFMALKRAQNATQIYAELTDVTGAVFTGPVIYSNGTTDVRADASATTYASYATTDWHTLAVTYDGATGDRKIYLDGGLVASGTAAFNPAALVHLVIGWAYDDTTLAAYPATMTWNRFTMIAGLEAPGDDNFDVWHAEMAARNP